MNKIKKTLMFFIVFLYLVNFVCAQVAARELAFNYALFSGKFYDLKEEEKIDFEYYNGTYSICENEKKTIPILVVNKNVSDKYFLEVAGANWISLNVKEFSLAKKQSGVIFLNLNPGQNTNGRYNIKVSGISSLGNVKRDLSIDVNVEKCYSLNLELEKESDKVCGGTKKQYNAEIINDGKKKIDIELSVKSPNWVSIDKNVFSIDADNKQKFELSIDMPADAKGFFDVFVSSIIKNLPSIKSEKNLRVEVVPKYDCYKADFITDAKIKNYYSNEYIPIKIRNSGIKQAVYDISLEAPNWISVGPKELTINSEQFGNLNLNINPSLDVSEGAYAIKINVKFDDIIYSKNINVILSKNQFLKALKSFFVFYQYYIYVVSFIIVLLFIFRRQISNKIKTKYKNYRIRKSRLKALEAARKAKQEKSIKSIRNGVSLELKPEKHKVFLGPENQKDFLGNKKFLSKSEFKKYRKKWLFFTLIIIALLLFFSIYQYNFPISKKFIKDYYLFFIVGILFLIFIVFLIIMFYRPLFRLLKDIDKTKKKK